MAGYVFAATFGRSLQILSIPENFNLAIRYDHCEGCLSGPRML